MGEVMSDQSWKIGPPVTRLPKVPAPGSRWAPLFAAAEKARGKWVPVENVHPSDRDRCRIASYAKRDPRIECRVINRVLYLRTVSNHRPRRRKVTDGA
jgi:hypothetical protein